LRPHVERGVDDGTLLKDSLVIRPFPHKNLLGHAYLRSSQTDPRCCSHGIDHVIEELLELIIKPCNG
jgi:hypothetical protein